MKQQTQFYWYCGTEQFQPEEIIEHAVAAEKAGFDGLMLVDHLDPWVDDKGASDTKGFLDNFREFSKLGINHIILNANSNDVDISAYEKLVEPMKLIHEM